MANLSELAGFALTVTTCCKKESRMNIVIYIRDSIALRFEPFKRMYENGSKIALNSACSKGFI